MPIIPPPQPNLDDPVPGGIYGRIDQGVDYVARKPVGALTSGTIEAIYHDMAAPNSTRVVERFDHPISVDGHTYFGAYYSEESALVKKGQHVKGGQAIIAPGSDEIGFLDGSGLNMPPLIGGLGAGTQPSQAGKDFAGLVKLLGGPGPSGSGNVTVGSGSTTGGPGSSGGIPNPFHGIFGGIESLIMQGFFILIGIGLIVVGLGLVAWAVMGRVGAPGIIGMAQTQMRINQAGERIGESHRASVVRETQAGQRIQTHREAGARSERRLQLQERNSERRTEKYVVKDKPNQVVRKKEGQRASGVPR